MPDTAKNGQAGQGKKILGMPRTTGLIVLGLAALVGGYLLISHFSGKKSSQGGQGSSNQPRYWGSGGQTVYVIREWQGHRPRVNPGGPKQ